MNTQKKTDTEHVAFREREDEWLSGRTLFNFLCVPILREGTNREREREREGKLLAAHSKEAAPSVGFCAFK